MSLAHRFRVATAVVGLLALVFVLTARVPRVPSVLIEGVAVPADIPEKQRADIAEAFRRARARGWHTVKDRLVAGRYQPPSGTRAERVANATRKQAHSVVLAQNSIDNETWSAGYNGSYVTVWDWDSGVDTKFWSTFYFLDVDSGAYMVVNVEHDVSDNEAPVTDYEDVVALTVMSPELDPEIVHEINLSPAPWGNGQGFSVIKATVQRDLGGGKYCCIWEGELVAAMASCMASAVGDTVYVAAREAVGSTALTGGIAGAVNARKGWAAALRAARGNMTAIAFVGSFTWNVLRSSPNKTCTEQAVMTQLCLDNQNHRWEPC